MKNLKKDSQNQVNPLPLITIATVCYNAEKFIEKTMESVLNQTYPNVEYLIIDGASKDHTLDKIRSLEPLFKEKGFNFNVSSEPDGGIYDAMNKAIKLAKGEWINFMNAGDYFNDEGVLSALFKDEDNRFCDILYGDTVVSLKFGKILMPPKPLDYLRKKMAFCHQSVFVRTEHIHSHPFDLHYKLAADYESFYYFYNKGLTFKYVPLPVSIFDSEFGESSQNRLIVNREYARINGASLKWNWKIKYSFKCFTTKAKDVFYDLLPEDTVKKIREKNYKRLSKRRNKQ